MNAVWQQQMSMERGLTKPHAEMEDGATQFSTVHIDTELSADEDEKTIQKLDSSGDLVTCEVDTDLEPYEGMEFESEEAAKIFYSMYARRVGFRIRISRYTRSRRDNCIISRRIVCSKEGFREDRPMQGLIGEPRQRHRATTRVGCKAMIMVKKIGTGRWVVTKFVKEHNHGPVPPRKMEVRIVRKDDGFVERSLVSGEDVVQEPYEGMEFDSEEAAKSHYSAYARHMGFRARISKYCRSRRDNSIISRQVVCSKEGFREIRVKEITNEGKLKRPRVITRIGCKAMIIVKKLNSGTWVVSKFEKEHNHALVTSKNVTLLQSHASTGKGSITNLQGISAVPSGVVMGGVSAGIQETSRESLTVLYNQLCCEAIRYAQEGAATVESYNVAMSALREAVGKVAAAKTDAVTTAQQKVLVSATNLGLTVGQRTNSLMVPAKALHELQCSNEVKQAIPAQELVLLQQPFGFVLIPSPNDSSHANQSKAPVIRNATNAQIIGSLTDSMNMACTSQGMNTTNPVCILETLPATSSVGGLVGNAVEVSDSPARRKRELQNTDADMEHKSVQKSQKLEFVGAGRANTTPGSGSNLSSPGLTEAQIMAIPTLPVTVYMPMMGSIPETCSVKQLLRRSLQSVLTHSLPLQVKHGQFPVTLRSLGHKSRLLLRLQSMKPSNIQARTL